MGIPDSKVILFRTSEPPCPDFINKQKELWEQETDREDLRGKQDVPFSEDPHSTLPYTTTEPSHDSDRFALAKIQPYWRGKIRMGLEEVMQVDIEGETGGSLIDLNPETQILDSTVAKAELTSLLEPAGRTQKNAKLTFLESGNSNDGADTDGVSIQSEGQLIFVEPVRDHDNDKISAIPGLEPNTDIKVKPGLAEVELTIEDNNPEPEGKSDPHPSPRPGTEIEGFTKMVLVMTESRHGSTWLMDILSFPHTSIPVFEPLNLQNFLKMYATDQEVQ